jgi:hypothetical protein
VAPFRVIPPPLAVASVGEAVSPSVMLMSSTLTVVLLSVVVVPLTVKLPESVKDAADIAEALTVPVKVGFAVGAFVSI